VPADAGHNINRIYELPLRQRGLGRTTILVPGKYRVSSVTTASRAASAREPITIHLIREGLWREAVYLYREEMGVSTVQAEQAIERLALEHGVHRYSRYFFVGMIALSGISVMLLASLIKMLS
jgi:hypothetical protein